MMFSMRERLQDDENLKKGSTGEVTGERKFRERIKKKEKEYEI